MLRSKRLTTYATSKEACKIFQKIFNEKCGYDFGGPTFKRPGKFYQHDIDFEAINRQPKAYVRSKLSEPILDLMKMIFNMKHIDKMEAKCILDLERVPLGQLSSAQIYSAMAVLKRISELIANQNGLQREFENASNEFYTLIPHGFSVKRPPIIDSNEMIKAKNELLESLLRSGAAYGYFTGQNGDRIHPFDACYEKITTGINLLAKNDAEFIKISDVVRNTHGATHNSYTLEVVDVYKLKRKREDVRSRTYKKLENRQMLWHGSRTTNFVSILTKGLRVAPKQAVSTGYMFGKGIYFADMVSKSANYCTAGLVNNTGLMLLCDVALGNSKLPTHAQDCSDLPNENEQSVKACGATYPTEFSTLDGIKIATGGLRQADFPTYLNYNEYVVYDINQVKMKYLVKVKFNYK